MKKRCYSGSLIKLALLLSLVLAMGMTALAENEVSQSTYTLTIPAALTVTDPGWNSAGAIGATGTLLEGAKLNVIATSDDEFALVSGGNKIGYTLKESSEGPEKTEWVFETLSETEAATQGVGIMVEEYTGKPGGIYTDTVTFTASAQTIEINNLVLSYVEGDRWDKIVERNRDIIESVTQENRDYIRRTGTNLWLYYQNERVQTTHSVNTNYLSEYVWRS